MGLSRAGRPSPHIWCLLKFWYALVVVLHKLNDWLMDWLIDRFCAHPLLSLLTLLVILLVVD